MRPMKDLDLVEQEDGNTRALTLADLGSEALKHGLDVTPTDTTLNRAGEDRLEGAEVLRLHEKVIPLSSITLKKEVLSITYR